MIGKEIVLGLAAIAWGSAALHFFKTKQMPDLCKLFFSSGWIGAFLGVCSLVSGTVYLVAGIAGWDIWPIP
jgi:hypothetical protein